MEASCRFCDVDHRRGSEDCPAQRIGRSIAGRYEIESLLGVGGMGAVYRARHKALGTHVAIKLVHAKFGANKDIADRFEREAQNAAKLKHPGIVAVTDLGRDIDGAPYLEMELLSGRSVDAAVRAGDMSMRRAVEVTIEALDAIEFAHQHHVIHRDLKPENLFLAATPTGERVKVVDFGIAKALELHNLTTTGTMMGTPMYMAPEQMADAKSVTAASDVYSMGATLFELLTGVTPVRGTTLPEVVAKVLSGDLVRAPRQLRADLPAWLDAIVQRALAKAPGDRYPSAAAMRDELVEGLRHSASISDARGLATTVAPNAPSVPASYVPQSIPNQHASVPVESKPGKKRFPATLIWSVIGTTVVGGFAVFMVTRTRSAQDTTHETPPSDAGRNRADAAPPADALVPPPPGMQRIEGATFDLGSNPEQIAAAFALCKRDVKSGCQRSYYEREQPMHRVKVSTFFLDQYEVTNRDFAAWLNKSKAELRGDTGYIGDQKVLQLAKSFSGVELVLGTWVAAKGLAARPMVLVTWQAAARYCADRGARLPTEAEWDLAAGGTERRLFPWGSNEPTLACDDVIHARERSQRCENDDPFADVGTAKRDKTDHAIHDLAGNASEWVADEFAERYPGCGDCVDPKVANAAVQHVVRGGAFNNLPEGLRTSGRSRLDDLAANVGFRCAATAKE